VRHNRASGTHVSSLAVTDEMGSSAWVVRETHELGSLGRGQLERVSVDLPDGTAFDQFVLRLPPAVVVAAVSEANELLMIRRFRFIVDRWLWELPGGYAEEGEAVATAAKRELEEETGWRAASVEHLVTFEPMVGSASAPNLVYVARDCVQTGSSIDINEANEVRWIPLDEAATLVASGEIVGSASVLAIAQLLAGTKA